jgi:hypothetical protein
MQCANGVDAALLLVDDGYLELMSLVAWRHHMAVVIFCIHKDFNRYWHGVW